MKLYLQFGNKMKQMSIDLAEKWGEATVILSPRDISPTQLNNWSHLFKKSNVHTMFDPQLYYPLSNNPNLLSYSYWNKHVTTYASEGFTSTVEGIIDSILEYNKIAKTDTIIVPCPLISYENNIDDWFKKWKKISKEFIECANRKNISNAFYTLALPANVLLHGEDIIDDMLLQIEQFDVPGFYIIAETPSRQYLVEEPLWLSNIMQLCAGLKLDGRKVIMGYGNHQMLCLSCAGIDALASGNYLNVRSFTNKFEKREEIKRKTNWYYNPLALSEYKIPFLDIAFTSRKLDMMFPPQSMRNDFITPLFESKTPPSTIHISETDLFKHYLHCLHVQCSELSKNTFEETFNINELLLSTAQKRISDLEASGIFAQTRSFRDEVDVTRSALIRLQTKRGLALSQEWKNF